MIVKEKVIQGIPYFTVLLFIILFVYAASSKLLEFQDFKVQLGQSPLLSSFAGNIAVGIPLVEWFLALWLLFGKFRLLALYCCTGLMSMFTTYIIMVLNFSDYVPCSCGGVMEQLNWTEHIIFNLFFLCMAAISILVMERNRHLTTLV